MSVQAKKVHEPLAPDWVKNKVPANVLAVLKPIKVIHKNRNGFGFTFLAVRKPVEVYKKAFCSINGHFKPTVVTLILEPGTVICVNDQHYKSRASKAFVSNIGVQGRKSAVSSHRADFRYHQGKHAIPDRFEMNPNNHCEPGIHFYFSKKQAENH